MKIGYFMIIMALLFLVGCTTKAEEYLSVKMVSNTEYWNGEAGQIIVELRDVNFNPKAANCTASILYPNSSYFVQTQNMTNTTALGTYHYNFIVPDAEGVYEYMASCRAGTRNYTSGRSFHVSNYRYFFEYEGADNVMMGQNITMGWREQTTASTRKIINATCNRAGNISYLNNNESFYLTWYVNSSLNVGRIYNLTCMVTADNTTINLTKYFRVDKSLRAWVQK